MAFIRKFATVSLAILGQTLCHAQGEVSELSVSLIEEAVVDKSSLQNNWLALIDNENSINKISLGDSFGSMPSKNQVVAVAPDGKTAYVCNPALNCVHLIDLNQNKQSLINVGIAPQAIAIDAEGLFAYVANKGSEPLFNDSSISIIDLTTKKATQLFFPDHTSVSQIALMANEYKMYVADQASNYLYVLDLSDPTFPVISHSLSLAQSQIFDIALTSNEDKLYAVTSDGVKIFETRTDTLKATLPILAQSIAFSNQAAYLTNSETSQILVVDAQTDTFKTSIDLLTLDAQFIEPSAIAMKKDGTMAYIANASQLLAVDISGTSPQVKNTLINNDSQIAALAMMPNAPSDHEPAKSSKINTTIASLFDQVILVPVIRGMRPSSGPAAGRNTIQIIGANFTDATAVAFGDNQALDFTVNNDRTITATVPPSGSGGRVVNVRVTTAFGISPINTRSDYRYRGAAQGPTIRRISPNSGPVRGGNTVTIRGTNFNGATVVDFGGNRTTNFEVESNTVITVKAPPKGSGTDVVAIRVITPNGASPLTDAGRYTYMSAGQGPRIRSISPNSGPVSGGNTITIRGANFNGTTAVSFGNKRVRNFTVDSNNSIKVKVPAKGSGPNVVAISITTPNGNSPVTAAARYTYKSSTQSPRITSISPNSGSSKGGNRVVITGTNLSGVESVRFGSKAARVAAQSNNRIEVIAPSGSRTVLVSVQTSNGTSNTLAYVYRSNPTPPPPPPTPPTPPPSSEIQPPSHFRGTTIENEFATQTEYTNHLTWGPSSSSGVVSYKLFRNGSLIATISADAFGYDDHNSQASRETIYTIAAVNGAGQQSRAVEVILN
jgi:DNA-binding beta-propeller fold protein YncE